MNFLLASSTDKLQLASSNAVNLDIHASYTDLASGTATPGRQNTAMTAAATTDILAAPGTGVRTLKGLNIRNKSGTATIVTVLYDANGTDYELYSDTLNGGEHLTFTEGIGWYRYTPASIVEHWRILSAGVAGQNIATAQPWFPTNGSLAVNAGEVYKMQGHLRLTRSAGTTSHTTSMGFGGTATLTAIAYRAWANAGDVVTLANTENAISLEAATATVVKAASTSATEQIDISLIGAVVINAAGTFIPQFTYSATPGGAPTVMAGSYFQMTKVSSNVIGPWS